MSCCSRAAISCFFRSMRRARSSVSAMACMVAHMAEMTCSDLLGERRKPMAKRDLLKLPDDFEGNLRALLATPPAPHGTAGSRKAAPKPPKKPKKKRRKPTAPAGTYAYESAPVKAKKRKAGKKR